MSDEIASLSFREYLSQRPRRYTPGSEILTVLKRDDEFAAITSQQELDDYLARRKVEPNGQIYAWIVWKGYLVAKKRGRRRSEGSFGGRAAPGQKNRNRQTTG